MQQVITAFRALVRRPGFTSMAIVTLALGIGANAAIFSVIDAVLLRPLPYPDADRLVIPWEFSQEVQQRTGFDRLPASPGDVTDFVSRNTTFESLAWMRADRVNLSGDGDPAERLGAVRVSRNFFETLGVQPVHGRAFNESDGQGGRTVLIGYGLWHRRFGGDPRVLEQPISVNGEPTAIVGVLPVWFRFPSAGELPEAFGYPALPEVWSLDILSPEAQRNRGGKSFALVGRMREGVTGRVAEADLNVIAADIARESPASNAGWIVRILPLREQLVGGVRPALMVLLTAVGFVLLIACANVANLLLVRATTRQREIAIRQALGAGRRRLVQQMLVESVVLSLMAGAAGLALAWWGLKALLAMIPATHPALTSATLDWRVAGFTVVIAVLTGLLFGMVPALQVARSDVSDGLRDGSRGTIGSRRARRMRNVFVVMEVALAVILLVGAVLLMQTFVRLMNVDTGFRADGVLTMEVALPRTTYPGNRPVDFFERLVARLAELPGVEGAAIGSSLPLMGAESLRQITIAGRPRPEPGQEIISDYRVVTPDYFRIMGVPHVAGDPLRAPGSPEAPRQLLINETMARLHFRDEDPIGKQMKLTAHDQDSPWFTISGIVGDTKPTALDSAPRPQVYVHHRIEPVGVMVVVLRTSGDPAGYASVARAAVHEIDRDQPVGRIRTMEGVVAESVSNRRFTVSLVGVFAALALMLSVVGLYAVVSHSVAERTQEMGLRLALGASPARLQRLVLGEGIRLVAVGVGLGLVGAIIAARLIEAQLFGVQAHDPITFMAVPILLFATALLGCLMPARRAMRVDPMSTLRAE